VGGRSRVEAQVLVVLGVVVLGLMRAVIVMRTVVVMRAVVVLAVVVADRVVGHVVRRCVGHGPVPADHGAAVAELVRGEPAVERIEVPVTGEPAVGLVTGMGVHVVRAPVGDEVVLQVVACVEVVEEVHRQYLPSVVPP
jgi:hypothetical protein